MRCHLKRLCSLLVALCCCFLLGIVNILRVQDEESHAGNSRKTPNFLPRHIESVGHMDKIKSAEMVDRDVHPRDDDNAGQSDRGVKGKDAVPRDARLIREHIGPTGGIKQPTTGPAAAIAAGRDKRHVNIGRPWEKPLSLNELAKRAYYNKSSLNTGLQNSIAKAKLAVASKHDKQHSILVRSKSNNFAEVHLPDRALHLNRSNTNLFPDPSNVYNDRIIQQLSFSPPEAPNNQDHLKVILAFSGTGGVPEGREQFEKDKCTVDTCHITSDVRWAHKADAVLFNFDPGPDTWDKPSHQVWVLFQLESPLHTPTLYGLRDSINWTATYRPDSTLVTPYEHFCLFPNASQLPITPTKNYAEGKVKKIAWFVSNCNPRNKRSEYVRELQKYIDVDVFGACGPNECVKDAEGTCNKMLQRDYKFYLSFENSNCQYYITEKFYWNSLG